MVVVSVVSSVIGIFTKIIVELFYYQKHSVEATASVDNLVTLQEAD